MKKEVAFIFCTNNEMYEKECTAYIEQLEVPAGYQVKIYPIRDAIGMAEGYNRGMKLSDAKYKVYMHHDMFIINKNFIYDMIDAFERFPEYGMLGLIGATRRVEDANYWDKWNVGRCDGWTGYKTISCELRNPEQIQEVEAIDGAMMITQVDIPWREDIFCKFDFYDVSQAMEFKKNGYKIGVPNQRSTWCYHDCGPSNLDNYDEGRMIFCEEYGDMGYCYKEDAENIRRICFNKEMQSNIVPRIEKALHEGNYDCAVYQTNVAIKYFIDNKRFMDIYVSELVIQEHLNANKEISLNIDEIINKFIKHKWFLIRLEHMRDIDIADIDLWFAKLLVEKVSINKECVFNQLEELTSKVLEKITDEVYMS